MRTLRTYENDHRDTQFGQEAGTSGRRKLCKNETCPPGRDDKAGSPISFSLGDLQIPGVQSLFYVRCLEGTCLISCSITSVDPFPEALACMCSCRVQEIPQGSSTYISMFRKLDHIGSPNSATTLRRWHTECREHHDCSSVFPLLQGLQDALPGRRLRLYFNKVDNKCAKVKLVKTWLTDRRSDYPYAALSHCWVSNPDKSHILTKSNEAERHKSIDLSTFPKTFAMPSSFVRGWT